MYAKSGQRPKTQAGGSRLGDAAQTAAEEEAEDRATRGDEARRLTVGDVDGLASKDGVSRILFSRATARSSLKEKVSHVLSDSVVSGTRQSGVNRLVCVYTYRYSHGFMQDQIICSHTCFGGHKPWHGALGLTVSIHGMDVNC